MTDRELNIHSLDAAYKPFPTFAVWVSQTSVKDVRWDRYNQELKSLPGFSAARLKWGSQIATRAAALDTGAIEGLYEVDRGFTFTVAFETASWEIGLAEKGENVRPLFEAQLHAYDYVLDLATRAEPISEAAIRVLHEVVCDAQKTYRVMTAVGPQEQPLPKGRYKSLPNHVRTRDGVDHSYAPVDVTPAEMARLVSELRSDPFLRAHPAMQAAYAHYALVVIHPFADGNGRVARALASAFTYRAISMPIMILSEHKDRYLDALEGADRGDLQGFVEFMLARSLDTIRLVEESVLNASSPSLEDSVAAIKGLNVTKGGYTHEQIDAGAMKLMQSLQTEINNLVAKYALSLGTTVAILTPNPRIQPGPGHRYIVDHNKAFEITLRSPAPAEATVSRHYSLLVPRDAASGDDIRLARRIDGVGTFEARVEDVVPTISGVLQMRIAIFAEGVLSEMLSELKPFAEKALRG